MRAYITGKAFTISRPFQESELSKAIEWCFDQIKKQGAMHAEIFGENGKLFETGTKINLWK